MMRNVKACAGPILPVFILILVNYAYALPIQYLPDVPGYIPVYIRYDNQPLEEINPVLAAAFHESTVISKAIGENRLDEHASKNMKKIFSNGDGIEIDSNKQDAIKKGPAQAIPLKQLIFELSKDQKDVKSRTQGSETIVEKLNEYLPLEDIEVKIIMDDQSN